MIYIPKTFCSLRMYPFFFLFIQISSSLNRDSDFFCLPSLSNGFTAFLHYPCLKKGDPS